MQQHMKPIRYQKLTLLHCEVYSEYLEYCVSVIQQERTMPCVIRRLVGRPDSKLQAFLQVS